MDVMPGQFLAGLFYAPKSVFAPESVIFRQHYFSRVANTEGLPGTPSLLNERL